MLALKRSPLRSAIRSLASSTAKILRFPARQEAVSTDPARRRMVAGTFAAAAVAPLPVLGGGGPGGPAENPELIAAGQAFDQAEAAFRAADERKREARALCEQLCPALPEELVLSREEREAWACGHPECDVEGLRIIQPNGTQRIISTMRNLRIEIQDYGPRTKAGKAARAKMKVAEPYEAAVASAQEQSGLPAAMEARDFALQDLEASAAAVIKAPALTLAGLQLKARAFAAFASTVDELGHRNEYRAAFMLARSLAENLLSITEAA